MTARIDLHQQQWRVSLCYPPDVGRISQVKMLQTELVQGHLKPEVNLTLTPNPTPNSAPSPNPYPKPNPNLSPLLSSRVWT